MQSDGGQETKPAQTSMSAESVHDGVTDCICRPYVGDVFFYTSRAYATMPVSVCMSVCPSVCDGSALAHYRNPPMSVTAAPDVAEIPDL